MAKNKNAFNLPNFRVNDEIRGFDDVRIIGDGIESKVVSLEEAKKIAYGMELDLIEINSKVAPPILKIASYEKFIYELKKNAKKNKQTAKPVKEIQLKATLTIKGRELTRREESKRSILEFIVMLDDVAVPESQPRDDGNKTIVVLKKKN